MAAKYTGRLFIQFLLHFSVLWKLSLSQSGCHSSCICEYVGSNNYLYVTCDSVTTFPDTFPSNTQGITVTCVDNPGIPAGAFKGLRNLIIAHISGDIGDIYEGAFDDLTGDLANYNGELVFSGNIKTIHRGAFWNMRDFSMVSFSYCTVEKIEKFAFVDLQIRKFQFYSAVVKEISTYAFDIVENLSYFHIFTSTLNIIHPCAFGGLKHTTEFRIYYTTLDDVRKYALGGMNYMDNIKIEGAYSSQFNEYGFAGSHNVGQYEARDNNFPSNPIFYDPAVNENSIRETCLSIFNAANTVRTSTLRLASTTTTTTTTTTTPKPVWVTVKPTTQNVIRTTTKTSRLPSPSTTTTTTTTTTTRPPTTTTTRPTTTTTRPTTTTTTRPTTTTTRRPTTTTTTQNVVAPDNPGVDNGGEGVANTTLHPATDANPREANVAAASDTDDSYKIGIFEIILFLVIAVMFIIIIILVVAVFACRRKYRKEYQIEPGVTGMRYNRPVSAITVQPVQPVSRPKSVYNSYDYYGNTSEEEVMDRKARIHRSRQGSAVSGKPPNGRRGAADS